MSAVTEPLSDAVGRGVAASRPAAGIAGRLYIASDTNAISRDNGTSWDTLVVGSSLTVKDEGGALSTAADTLDFVGAGVVASGTGSTKTITIAGASALTVEEVDGSPTDAAITKIVFPNDSVSIASHIATVRQVPYGFIGVKAQRTASQTLTTATWTAISLTAADDFDSDNFHDPASNADRVIVPAGLGGKYLAIVRVVHNQTNAGARYVGIGLNAASTPFESLALKADQQVHHGLEYTTVVSLVAGDYVRLFAYQDSGGNNDVLNGTLQLVKLDSGRVGQGIGARAYNTAGTSLANNTPTAMPLASEEFDTDGFHDTVTNNSRMTCPAGLGGTFLVIGQYTPGFASSADSIYAIIRKNATTDYAFQRSANAAGTSTGINISAAVPMVPGDYVELIVNQNRGSAGPLETTAGYNSLEVTRLDSGSGDVQRAHACRVKRASGNVSVGNNTYTVIPFNGTEYDTDPTMHDNSTNPSRIIIPTIPGVTTGLWSIKASGYSDQSSGRTDAQVRKNSAGSSVTGTLLGFGLETAATGIAGFLTTFDAVLTAGDYVELFVRTSAASGNVLYDGDAGPIFSVSFQGKVT